MHKRVMKTQLFSQAQELFVLRHSLFHRIETREQTLSPKNFYSKRKNTKLSAFIINILNVNVNDMHFI